jgi:tripartite-type tricarboxylate transporter receptor subunit TctC
MAGFFVQHVPYTGSTPAMRALLRQEIDFIFEGVVPAAPLIQDGVLTALGLSTQQRIPALDVEPVASQGLNGFDLRGWWGLFAPARTPSIVVQASYDALREGLREPDFLDLAHNLGLIVNGESPAAFAQFIGSEIRAYRASTSALMMIRPEDEFMPA